MKDGTRRAVLTRVRSAQGDLKGIEKTVEEDKYGLVDIFRTARK